MSDNLQTIIITLLKNGSSIEKIQQKLNSLYGIDISKELILELRKESCFSNKISKNEETV